VCGSTSRVADPDPSSNSGGGSDDWSTASWTWRAPAGGAPLADRGPGGGSSGGTLSVDFCMYGLGSLILYRVLDTHFCTHRGEGIHGPMGDCTCIFFVNTYDLHDIYIYIYIYFDHACSLCLCFYV
jgi:hypothetical protein